MTTTDPPMYVIHCGTDNVTIDEVRAEAIAMVIAMDHESAHRCGAWWESPIEHAAFYAPNVHLTPRTPDAGTTL